MAIDYTKTLEARNGLLVYQRSGGTTIEGPLFTGDPKSPMGLNLPINSYYIQTLDDGILAWRKFGNGIYDWVIDKDTVRNALYTDCYIPTDNTRYFKNTRFENSIIIDGEGHIL